MRDWKVESEGPDRTRGELDTKVMKQITSIRKAASCDGTANSFCPNSDELHSGWCWWAVRHDARPSSGWLIPSRRPRWSLVTWRDGRRDVRARDGFDVWKSELSVFVSANNVNMDIRICIRFKYRCQMDVFESDFQYYPNSTLSEISDKNSIYPTLFVSAKIKYP
jgi:hypothetical protein